MTNRIASLVLVVPFVLAGCQADAPTTGEKVFDVKGKVVSIEPDKSKLMLDHEDIPGLMKAMTMSFAVAEPSIVETIKPGDVVTGKLKVEAGKYTITQLQKR